jgi:hypothetical protein
MLKIFKTSKNLSREKIILRYKMKTRRTIIICFSISAILIFTTITSGKLSKNGALKAPLKFDMPVLENRRQFGKFLEENGYKIAIEVGVFKGSFAMDLLKTWPSFEKYYGIDPYVLQKNYKDRTNLAEEKQDGVYNRTLELLTSIGGDRVKLIRKPAMEGVKEFEDNSVDFIYLDGRHNYCAVREELDAYYPKLKCNGIMAGHDFMPPLVNIHTDWRVCENGTIVTIKGGGVKGI